MLVINRNKTRLLAKCYNQEEEIDYEDTSWLNTIFIWGYLCSCRMTQNYCMHQEI